MDVFVSPFTSPLRDHSQYVLRSKQQAMALKTSTEEAIAHSHNSSKSSVVAYRKDQSQQQQKIDEKSVDEFARSVQFEHSVIDTESSLIAVRISSSTTSSPHQHHHHHHSSQHITNNLDHACGHVRQSFWNVACGCLFSFIPDEVMLFSVFTLLNHEDLSNAAAVCTRWRHLSSDRFLWSKIDLSKHAKTITDATLTQLMNK